MPAKKPKKLAPMESAQVANAVPAAKRAMEARTSLMPDEEIVEKYGPMGLSIYKNLHYVEGLQTKANAGLIEEIVDVLVTKHKESLRGRKKGGRPTTLTIPELLVNFQNGTRNQKYHAKQRLLSYSTQELAQHGIDKTSLQQRFQINMN